ncbi:hypothetical protein E2C01_100390 [Portunus trituberculatus]|uniref:Uncharacterized protein n=1 Tax=Portunus trituberculatus TaxID=210409 RepID=A0A5B7KDG0_PORTR|nr:hypothetical protein [Portunus trituberculatus]
MNGHESEAALRKNDPEEGRQTFRKKTDRLSVSTKRLQLSSLYLPASVSVPPSSGEARLLPITYPHHPPHRSPGQQVEK